MIYTAPSSTENVYIEGLPTGLTGTLQFKLIGVDGTVAINATTSGITEVASGRYKATFTTPSTAGDYIPQWINGATTYDDNEFLRVQGGGALVSTSGDLTTLPNVRTFLQKQGTDTNQDAVISSLITRASKAIMRYCEREFAPASTGVTRTFETELVNDGWMSLAPYDLRNLTSVVIDSDTGTPETLSTDEYRLWPRPNPDGTFLALRLEPLTLSVARIMYRNRQVQVTGDWGFASVPSDIEHACIVTVAIWLRRDVATFERTFSVDEARLERPKSLPSAVEGTLDLYRRRSF